MAYAGNKLLRRLVVVSCMMALTLGAAGGAWAQAEAPAAERAPSEEQLRRWLKQYPQADADRDGVLTWPEARAYRQQLLDERAKAERARSGDKTEYTHATMSDGVKIALAVAYPRGFDPADTKRKWPAVLRMSGYPGQVETTSPGAFANRYVTVSASVRGTGASGGVIRIINPRTGLDGHEIIENWIVKQPWSDGKVAVEGHSWPGLTGFTIAATNPPHLRAVAVSGLFDDVYRGIARMGGIRNSGFPVSWMNNLYRPTGVFGSDQAAIRLRGIGEAEYQGILAARPARDLAGDLLWITMARPEDSPEWQVRSPDTHVDSVRAPIYIMHAYQDQQTGPSGAWLWHKIADDVPKRLVLTNGNHGMPRFFPRDRQQWFDFWLLGDGKEDPSDLTDRDRRVRVYFETALTESNQPKVNEPQVSSDFPLTETRWTRCYFRAGNRMSTEPPAEGSGTGASGDAYQVTIGAADDEIDSAHYLLGFDEPTAICGPIVVTLWATSTTLDTDFFVLVADVDEEGHLQHLQRGMLRASHRGLDEEQSEWVTVDERQVLIRPHHPHRDPQPLVPGEPYRFEIEVFPVGHVFRAGHQLAVRISQPPLVDPVPITSGRWESYTYESALPPGTVTILRDAEHPSSILLPVLPDLPPLSDEPLPPGSQAGIQGVRVD
jgi:predicted acyl esterase